MSVRRGILLAAVLSALFLLANRAAYKGYFSGDDLDNILQTRGAGLSAFGSTLVSPKLSLWNFRPVGHFYYKALGGAAGLRFAPYLAVLHLLHLLNVLLLWRVLRRLGASELASGAGAALFAFHMACFDAYWKPMFIFDVACAFFLLAALLLYLEGRWLLALIPYWLAYKSKEPAIALPALLLLYEWLLGGRRWRRVLPFASIALSFGLQAILANRGPETDYTLRFTPRAVWTTLSFYSSQILLAPLAGLLLIPAACLAREPRIRFGLAAVAVLLGPMWFLPGRLFAVYLYVPLIGLAIAAAFTFERLSPRWVAAFFLVWIPVNYMVLRRQRGAALAAAQEARPYVEQVQAVLAAHPDWNSVVYDGAPPSLERWGVRAAFQLARAGGQLQVEPLDSAEGRALLAQPAVQTAAWNRAQRHIHWQARVPGAPPPAFIDMAQGNPAWLFGPGWFGAETGYRWMEGEARATLARPARASEFVLRINFGPVQFRDQGVVEMEVLLDGHSLGTRNYTEQGWHERRWPLPAGPAGAVEVTLRSLHPYRPSNGDPRLLGAAVAAFGFVD
jgi:hypothetical protein